MFHNLMASSGGEAGGPVIWAYAHFSQRVSRSVSLRAARRNSWSINSSPCWTASRTHISSAHDVWATITVSNDAPCPRAGDSCRYAMQSAKVHLNNMDAAEQLCRRPTPAITGGVAQSSYSKVTLTHRAARTYAIARGSGTFLLHIARRIAEWRVQSNAREVLLCQKGL